MKFEKQVLLKVLILADLVLSVILPYSVPMATGIVSSSPVHKGIPK
jgi:hypothetical protein